MRPQLRGGIQALSGLLLLSVACGVGCNGCSSSSSSSGSTTGSTGTTGTTGSGGNPPPTGGVQVLTYHNDNTRQGENTQETVLTTANVNSTDFGKVGFYSTDGKVDAEPLYVPGETIGGASHNVLYVVTEHDSAYAFDADTGTVLWHVSTLGANETTSDSRNCGQVVPEIGMTSTPAIDPKAGAHGTIYMVAASKDSNGNYHQRLHALDLTTGAEQTGSPVTIQATYPSMGPESSNGQVVFDPKQYNERAGLLLLNGVVYLGWSSHCDIEPYTGWLMGYNENTLAQTSVLNLTPNGSEGSIWQSGAGLAADSSGNIYFLDANGSFGTTLDASGNPANGDYGNAFMKVSTAGNQLTPADYFTMSNTVAESNADEDLGSGGAMLLPDETDASGTVRHLAVGAGKDANIYVVDRDNMGKFSSGGNNIYQELGGALSGQEFGMPAYWNNTVYYGGVSDSIRAYPITQAKLATTPSSKTAHQFPYPGATPSVSSNGASNGIVWAVDNSSPAVLYAYDATNLTHELYDSNQAAGGRDQFGPGNKYITPMIVNGKVYVGTTNGVAVFGLLK
ncbi:MAG: pyrrolo-quinoline quinone [Acidobacteriaceae bacterium]